ncbi:hypothetical protein ABE424_13080 [Stenotrophomonas sp. TWI1149]|uniref:hypothetical protein n=1 Tax=unclassified Stenotrophomonas TaxID=196198 RepID=UPI00320A8DE9
MSQEVQALAMAWFEESDYEAFRLVLRDRHWHNTFEDWEADAEQGVERFKNQGIRAIKAKVTSVELVAWCHASGRNVDTQALLAYANEAAYRQLLDEQ